MVQRLIVYMLILIRFSNSTSTKKHIAFTYSRSKNWPILSNVLKK